MMQRIKRVGRYAPISAGRPLLLTIASAYFMFSGVAIALLSGTDTEGDRNATKDAALGGVFGFAILGGGIAFYDWVCKPDSGSQRAGLC